MAASIFHGAPGSFKSASAVYFEVLPALRKGRLVVTNIEGLLKLEDIEIALQESFPESAKLWRMSSQTEKGLHLWRRWYHWMPPTALVVIDEVQDVYPTESTFKPESCDYVPISKHKETPPDGWFDTHMQALEDYKPDNLTSGDIDDLGEVIFNDNGHIIYPKTLKEAYMRHRKYNWDIICCTPDITSVHKYIRNVSQYAYAHKYFDGLEFIPYFNRRPRVHEHNPKLNGTSITKGTPVNWKKVPVEVHKLYKSTSTGNTTKGQGKNFFKSPAVAIPFTLLFGALLYLLWFFTLSDSASESAQANFQEAIQVPQSGGYVLNSDDRSSPRAKRPVSLALPFDANKAWFTGTVTKYRNGQVVGRHYTFTLDIDGSEYTANGSDFRAFGYTLTYINDCTVHARKDGERRILHCRPQLQEERVADNTHKISIFGDDAAPSGA